MGTPAKVCASLHVSSHSLVLLHPIEAATVNNSAVNSDLFSKINLPRKGHPVVKVLDQNTEDRDSILCLPYFVSCQVTFRLLKMQLSSLESPTANFTVTLEVKTPLKIYL